VSAWVAGCLGLLGGIIGAVSSFGHGGAAYGLSVALRLIMMGLFAWMSGRFLCEARRNGELELLVTTTGGATGIVRDQWFAIVRLLRGPLVLIGVGAVPAAAASVSLGTILGHAELGGLIAGVLNMGNAILGVFAICWVGMWRGLFARRPSQAVLWTVGLVEGIPLLAGLVIVLMLRTWFAATGRTAGLAGWVWLLAIPLLEFGKNLFFIWWANRRLCSALRVPEVRWFASQRTVSRVDREIQLPGVPTSPD
jgi:hypothetical protein